MKPTQKKFHAKYNEINLANQSYLKTSLIWSLSSRKSMSASSNEESLPKVPVTIYIKFKMFIS